MSPLLPRCCCSDKTILLKRDESLPRSLGLNVSKLRSNSHLRRGVFSFLLLKVRFHSGTQALFEVWMCGSSCGFALFSLQFPLTISELWGE